jgi:purine-binding chemotaxis protein CheW
MSYSSGDRNTAGYLEVDCAGKAVAIPIEFVREIHQVPYLEPVPYGEASVAGILNFRGVPIISIDLEVFLGLEPRERKSSDKLLILEYGQQKLTIVVGGVRSVLKKAEIERVTVVGASSLLLREDHVTFALDMDSFFGSFEDVLRVHEANLTSRQRSVENPEELRLMKERAGLLEGSARKRSVSIGRQIAMVRIGNETYGVDLTRIVEFYETYDVVPVPCTPSHVLGIISLRGEIISVLDPGKALGLEDDIAEGVPRQILVFEHEREMVGVHVHEVVELVMVDETALRPVPTVVNPNSAKYLCEAIKIEGTIYGVFDMPAFLTDPRWTVDSSERLA